MRARFIVNHERSGIAALIEYGARIHSHTFMPLPGMPLKHARPVPIERSVELGLSRFEARGALYGQWRQQRVKSAELVGLRRTSRSATRDFSRSGRA